VDQGEDDDLDEVEIEVDIDEEIVIEIEEGIKVEEVKKMIDFKSIIFLFLYNLNNYIFTYAGYFFHKKWSYFNFYITDIWIV